MVTKSGKHHYRATFRLYEFDGTLSFEDTDFRFATADKDAYIQQAVSGYGRRTAELTDIVDLDA